MAGSEVENSDDLIALTEHEAETPLSNVDSDRRGDQDDDDATETDALLDWTVTGEPPLPDYWDEQTKTASNERGSLASVATTKTTTTGAAGTEATDATLATDSDEEKIPLWKKVIPHLALTLTTVLYVLMGVALFRWLERDSWYATRLQQQQALEAHKRRTVDRLWQLGLQDASYEEAEAALEAYMQLAYDVYQATPGDANYLLHTDRYSPPSLAGSAVPMHNDTENWSFGRTVFFVVGSITTVGFGEIVPSSTTSRVALMAYSVVGIPILLITTADFAKFISTFLSYAYERYLRAKHDLLDRICGHCRRRLRYEDEIEPEDDISEADSMVDYLYDNLEGLHEVRVPSAFIFALLLAYCCLGGYVFSSTELWRFADSMYFGFIGIMKIGFGDFIPSNNVWAALTYNFVGLILTTMCIDVVGVHYLERIHQFGRRMTTADYLALLKEAKLRRKRKETMRRHYDTLLMVMKMQLPTRSEPAVKEEPEDKRLSIKQPQTPINVRIADLTPYMIQLAWSPAEYDETTEFIVKYNLKHSKATHTITVRDLTGGYLDLKGLRSFSMYEISMFSVNPIGRSQSVRLIQVTEPETCPQRVAATVNEEDYTVLVTWSEPCKKAKDVISYTVYYIDDPENKEKISFDKWCKLSTDKNSLCALIGNLQPGRTYAFCASSVFAKSGHSPISKAVIVTLPNKGDTASECALLSESLSTTAALSSATNHDNQPPPPANTTEMHLMTKHHVDRETLRLAKSSSNHSEILARRVPKPTAHVNYETKSLL